MPNSGSNISSISSALDFVKLNPDPCGAFIITKNAPLSSGAINSLGAKLNKNRVKAKVPAKKEIIIFFFLIHIVKDCLYEKVIPFKKFSNLVTVVDFFIFFFKNLLANIGLRERATKLDITTAEAKVIAVCVNKTPVIPLIKTKGTNTATKTTVVAIIANETCFAPL